MRSFIFDQQAGETPETIAQKRKIADALASQAVSTAPMQSWTQGLAQVVAALGSKYQSSKANSAETAGRAGANSGFENIINAVYGGKGEGVPTGHAPAPAAPPNSFSTAQFGNGDLKMGIEATAKSLGINPMDLATAISYETAGTFDPAKAGPTTQWGQHRGLIQFGEPQAKQYGVDWNNPVGSQLGPNGAVAKYLKDAGVQPGMGLMDVYSAINAGHVGKYNASDANNGGAPGTVADKVNTQMAGHRANAEKMFGTGGATVQPAGYSPGAAQQGGQLPMAQIIELMGNPYLNEGQQGILAQIVKQKMADGQMSEKDMLDLEQARLTNEKLKAEIEKTRTGKGESSKRGLNLMYWQDKSGGLHAGQLSEGGGIEEVPLPEGGQWAPGVGFLDTGTGFVPYNKRTGVIPQPAIGGQPPAAVPGGGVEVPKNLAEAEKQKSLGKDEGDNIALYKSMTSKMPGLEQVVSELDNLAGKATYTLGGQLLNAGRKELGLAPNESAVARTDYQAKVANQILPLLRDTFGAQFTQVEGERLMATLGNPDATPEEKQAVLKTFIAQKRRDIEALAIQTGQKPPAVPSPAATQGPQPGMVEDGFRFKGGDPADPNNWEAVQ